MNRAMGLQGVITATLTPMLDDLSIDFPRLIRHCESLLAGGSDGIALLGTTGEANSFSVGERLELIDAVSESSLPGSKLLIGTGTCALPDTVRLSRHALDRGFSNLLMLPPFYYKNLTDQGLEAYFREVIDRIGTHHVRIILYHFPKLTGVPFSMRFLEKMIGSYPGIVCGIKDSSGDFENMRAMCAGLPDFSVFAGTEKFLLDLLRLGGAGCISATANITCVHAAEVCRRYQSGAAADELQARLTAVRTAMDAYPLIGLLKRMMHGTDDAPGWLNVRPPNMVIPEPDYQELTGRLTGLGAGEIGGHGIRVVGD